MKNHRIELMLFLALFGCATVSCTKEELTEKPCAVVTSQSAAYVVDGRLCYANPQTEEEWAACFGTVLPLEKEGESRPC